MSTREGRGGEGRGGDDEQASGKGKNVRETHVWSNNCEKLKFHAITLQ